MTKTPSLCLTTLAVTLAFGLASADSGAQEIEIRQEGDRQVVRIDGRKVVKLDQQMSALPCAEGEDCETVQVRRIFISDDGKMEEVSDGEWIDEHGLIDISLAHAGEPRVLFAHAMGKGFLGVQLVDLTPDLRTHFGVPENEGVMVSLVVEDSPAAHGGVLVGDIISGVDGERIASPGDLIRRISGREPGEQIALELWRDGKLQSTTVAVGERELSAHTLREHALSKHGVHVIERACEGDDCPDPGENPHVIALCEGQSDCDVEIECQDGTCVGAVGDRQLRWQEQQEQ